jgi:hypothetical protein
MHRYHVIGPLGPDCCDYGEVLGVDPLSALHRVHRDALGSQAVRRKGDRLVFADPADQQLCAGRWRVWQVATNAEHQTREFSIADPIAAKAA